MRSLVIGSITVSGFTTYARHKTRKMPSESLSSDHDSSDFGALRFSNDKYERYCCDANLCAEPNVLCSTSVGAPVDTGEEYHTSLKIFGNFIWPEALLSRVCAWSPYAHSANNSLLFTNVNSPLIFPEALRDVTD
jgi:hypothetical protein